GGGGEGDPHEELTGLPIPKLIGFRDVGAEGRQLRGDRGDDAGTIDAGQGEDEGRGHGTLCDWAWRGYRGSRAAGQGAAAPIGVSRAAPPRRSGANVSPLRRVSGPSARHAPRRWAACRFRGR